MSTENELIEYKKKYLKRYKKNLSLINRLKLKLEFLNERIGSAKVPTLSDVPRGGVPITDADLISDRIELEERISRLEIKSNRLKQETLEVIDELDDPRYAEILESFFVDCKEFDQIAKECHYTVRHVIRLYHEGIERCKIENEES